ncbi:hypothetical protein VP01_7449g1, partial [Puccinia sorghi]
SKNNCSPCSGTQMKTTARRQLTSPSSEHSIQELIGQCRLRFPFPKGASESIEPSNSTIKKFPAKPFTPSASTSAPRSRKPTKIALVLNKEGQLNSEEQARREREGLCFYCGGKHELESCVKRCGKKNCLSR